MIPFPGNNTKSAMSVSQYMLYQSEHFHVLLHLIKTVYTVLQKNKKISLAYKNFYSDSREVYMTFRSIMFTMVSSISYHFESEPQLLQPQV